jgi:HEAT repeat protein
MEGMRQWVLRLAAVLLLFLCVLCQFPAGRRALVRWVGLEKTFQGQPAHVWSAGLKAGQRPEAKRRGFRFSSPAARELREGGPAAVPVLLELLNDPDPHVRLVAGAVLADMGPEAGVPALVAVLDHGLEFAGVSPSDDQDRQMRAFEWYPVREEALRALIDLGPGAEPAVPVLVHQLKARGYQVSPSVIDALGAVGPPAQEALPHLVDLVRYDRQHPKRDDSHLRARAAQAAWRIDPTGRVVIPALFEFSFRLLRDPAVRRAFSSVGPRAAASAAAALVPGLDDADPDVRLWAAEALGNMGPRAADAVPRLVTLLERGEPQARAQAAKALGAIGSGARSVVAALCEHVKDPDPKVRWQAITALSSLGPDARAAVPALIEALQDPDAQAWAARALGSMAPVAKTAIPALVKGLDGGDLRFRLDCAAALGEFGGEAREAVPSLIRGLNDPELSIPQQSCRTLAAIGPAAREAVPALADAVRGHKDIFARAGAALALGRIGPGAAEAVEALVGALGKDQYVEVRLHAAWALGEIGQKPEVVVPALTRLLDDGEWSIRLYAAEALGKFGPRAQPAVAALVREMAHRAQGWAWLAAAQALWRIDHRTDETVPVLAAAFETGDDAGKVIAATTLGEMGPAAREAAPALRKALRDEDALVRIEAAAALARVEGRPEVVLPVLIARLRGDNDDRAQCRAAEALGEMGEQARDAVPALTEAREDRARNVREAAARALRKIVPGG